MTLKRFNAQRYLQAIAYVQERCNSEHHLKSVKMMFFADRYNLRRYGTLLTFDDYKAMNYGPVGSQGADVLTLDEFYLENIGSASARYLKEKVERHTKEHISISLERGIDLLSPANIEALDFAIKHFGSFDRFELAAISHDYPEWRRFADLFKTSETKQERIIMQDFFTNPPIEDSKHIQKYLRTDPFDEPMDFLAARRDDFLQYERPFC